MTLSFGVFLSRATILRASSNGQACESSAISRSEAAGLSVTAIKAFFVSDARDIAPNAPRIKTGWDQNGLRIKMGCRSKWANGEIAQPKIGIAALLPLPEQCPIQRLAQQIVAAPHRDADALAEKTALQIGA